MKPIIASSILSANFAHLGREIKSVLEAGADWIHFDVMDQHFVPNLTIGPMVCQALRDDGITAPIDVHLMVDKIDELIPKFIESGADCISFHPEASADITQSLHKIKAGGAKSALAINPDVPLSVIEPYWQDIDMLLIMSVFPGFSGQKFIPDVLYKVEQARAKIKSLGLNIRLEIDGGINNETIKLAAQAGCDTFVAGSAIFDTHNYRQNIQSLTDALWL